MKAGNGKGVDNKWGWGSVIPELFDRKKIQVINAARGGRTTRSYIDEGLWEEIVEQLKPGDYVLIEFGHNEYGNSEDHRDRITLRGNGEETTKIKSPLTGDWESIHTYGWYLQQYAQRAAAQGAIPIICSPVPRNSWSEGRVDRGFYGYARWAAEAAETANCFFLDLNRILADRYDNLGREETAKLFVDAQHTNRSGAKVVAEAAVEGIRQLKGCHLRDSLAAPEASP